MVEINTLNDAGHGIRKQLEVDFVANKGYDRYYIQSAYGFSNESKKEQEKDSLRSISDSFERIIVTGDGTLPYWDDDGHKVENLIYFLLNDF